MWPPSPCRSSDSIVPRCSMIRVNIVKVSFDGQVRAELREAQILQIGLRKLRSGGERHARVAGDFWRVEEHQLVDDLRGESRAVQRRTCFQQHAEDVAAAKLRERFAQMEPSQVSFYG